MSRKFDIRCFAPSAEQIEQLEAEEQLAYKIASAERLADRPGSDGERQAALSAIERLRRKLRLLCS